MKKVILLVIILTMTGCKMLRKVKESTDDTTSTEQTIQKTFRKGDTIYFDVPRAKYKDTTIYSVNRQGTTLRTVFNEEGNVSDIECLTSRIDELLQINKGLRESKSDRETESEKMTKGININIIIIAALVLAFFYFDKRRR